MDKAAYVPLSLTQKQLRIPKPKGDKHEIAEIRVC